MDTQARPVPPRVKLGIQGFEVSFISQRSPLPELSCCGGRASALSLSGRPVL
jgi:hypothetical protein